MYIMVTLFDEFLIKNVFDSGKTYVFPTFIIMSPEKSDGEEITERFLEYLKPYSMKVYDDNDLVSILLPCNKQNKELVNA